MLRNFFKTAVRNILRHKAYSIINFVGLTCGVTLALLIMVYVRSETSFDTFHEKIDRLYRVRYMATNGFELALSPLPMSDLLPDYFPEVERSGRMFYRNVSVKSSDAKDPIEETEIFFADSSILKMMTFEFVKGNPKNALNGKFTAIITEEMATKYFGDKDPIGETLLLAGDHSFRVVAVMKKLPENSHLKVNMLIPYENMYDLETEETSKFMKERLLSNFVVSHSMTYVLLKEGASPQNVDSKFDAFLKKYAPADQVIGQVFNLFPVRDIHMTSIQRAEPNPTNTWANIYIFSGVGLLTIIIACINYINLSTAQSLTRVKEIGIRKILGSFKYQIIIQFLAESFLFCLIAFMISFAAFYFTLPFLNEVMGKNLVFSQVVDQQLVLVCIGLLLFITLLAGGYPAYFVTRFESINTIKGNGTAISGGQWFRKALIVFQLGIACMLLSGSLLIIKQLNYLGSQPLGFKRDQIITIPLFSSSLNVVFGQRDSLFTNRVKSFREKVEGLAGVKVTTMSSNVPGMGAIFKSSTPEGFTKEDNLSFMTISADYDFFELYDIEMVAGRSFSRDFGTDPAEGIIVNETAVKEFKWESPEKAIGKTMLRGTKNGKVVGVMKDVYFLSLKDAMLPLITEYNINQMNQLSIRFESSRGEETVKQIESAWNSIFPEKAFVFNYLDEQLDKRYRDFKSFGVIIETFTFIAIMIACLGVYGLVLFVVQRKVKEIGVRKVLGANIRSILNLIYRDFALLIAIAFILASPVAWYFMDKWLQNFKYHTNIDISTFVFSLILVIMITSLTIAYQAIKASMANPVKSLRTE